MARFKLIPVGMRMVKTGLAVVLCLLLARLFGYAHYPPLYACMAAILATKDTVENSLKAGVDRTVATLVGGLIAIVLLFFDFYRVNEYLEILVAGLGCVLTLYFCVLIKSPEAAALACVVFLVILLQHSDDKYVFALVRMGETVTGIGISIVINRFVNPRRWFRGKRPRGEDPPDAPKTDAPQ